MTETITAVVAGTDGHSIVTRAQITLRSAFSNEAMVKVVAFSINRGECRRAERSTEAVQIGWDFVGKVDQAAADGSGPAVGTRVVGFSPRMEGWAEKVCINTNYIAPIPDAVSDAQAATLPVAGLTALHSVDAGTCTLGNKALITGATGGVGLFAVQLARLAGAEVYAQVRRADQVAFLEQLGPCVPVISSKGAGIGEHGPFRLVIDGISGDTLKAGIEALSADGMAVVYGVSDVPEIDFNISHFMTRGLAQIMGFHLYNKSESAPPSIHLGRLLRLMEAGQLVCPLGREASWEEVDDVASGLINRTFSGKAVLHI
jgi:NADPH:quinone reductase-like Zn-dependent oxidoreductase